MTQAFGTHLDLDYVGVRQVAVITSSCKCQLLPTWPWFVKLSSPVLLSVKWYSFQDAPKKPSTNTTTCIYGGGTWVSPSGRTDLRTFSWWKLPVEAVATFWCPPGSTRRIPLDSIDSYFFWTLPLNPLLIARQDSFWTCGTGDGLKPPEIDTATRWNPGSSFCVHQIGTSFVMHLLLAKKVKHQLCMAKILGDHFPQHWFLKWLNGVEDLVVPPKIIQILSNTNIYKL